MFGIHYIDRYVLQTKLSRAEVLKRLDAVIDAAESYTGAAGRRKPFIGRIAESDFEARRNSFWSRNPSVPTMKGKVFREGELTIIEAELSLGTSGVIGTGVLLAFILIMTIAIIVNFIGSIIGTATEHIPVLSMLSELIFLYGMAIIVWIFSYVRPANSMIRILRKRLDVIGDEITK